LAIAAAVAASSAADNRVTLPELDEYPRDTYPAVGESLIPSRNPDGVFFGVGAVADPTVLVPFVAPAITNRLPCWYCAEKTKQVQHMR
jgi:hypothetical protein